VLGCKLVDKRENTALMKLEFIFIAALRRYGNTKLGQRVDVGQDPYPTGSILDLREDGTLISESLTIPLGTHERRTLASP